MRRLKSCLKRLIGRADAPAPATLCALPFIHFNVQANGQASVCCVSTDPLLDDGKPLNVRTHSLDEIWNSRPMTDIRRQMLVGEKPTHCAVCYDYEKTGFRSHRMEQNAIFLRQAKLASHPGKPWYFDLRFDNVCNLKCIICYGGASSQIERDPVHIRWTGEQPIERVPNRFASEEWVKTDQLFQELKDIGSKVTFIQLAGGEPFLSHLALRWLAYLGETRRARGITLKVFTNLQTFNDKLVRLLEPFKVVDMTLSIDGTGPVYEYVRFPGKWRTIEKNVASLAHEIKAGRLRNATANINVTMSAHSALDATTVFDVAKRYGFYCTLNAAVYPAHASPRFLPESSKDRLEKLLRQYAAENPGFPHLPSQIDQWMREIRTIDTGSEAGREGVTALMQFTNDMDASRGLRFRDVMPEVYQDFEAAFGAWHRSTRHFPLTVVTEAPAA